MSSPRSSRVWAALSVSLALAQVSVAQDIPVFIFAGQSNMIGHATNTADLTAAQQQQQPTVFFTNRNPFDDPPSWSLLQPPTVSGNRFGPEVVAPQIVSNSMLGADIAVVKFALGDSPLARDGARADWDPTNPAQELYFGMTLETSNSLAVLPSFGPAAGRNGSVAGFFWMQGEADAQFNHSNSYQQNLINFIQTVRAEYGDPNLPFVMGLTAFSGATGSTVFHVDTVRRAQMNVANILGNVAVVETSDLARTPGDGFLHLTSQGTYDLGERMGRAYVGLQNPLPQGPASMNTLTNGGFEDHAVFDYAPFPGTRDGVTYPSGIMPGWTGVTADGHTLVNNRAFGGADSPEGQQYLSLENKAFGPGNGGAQQTVSLTPGQMYTLVYSYSAISLNDNFVYQFTVDHDGADLATHNVPTAGTPANELTAWSTGSITFTASDSSETIKFIPTITNETGFYGPAIDNVRLVQGSVWNDNVSGNDWDEADKWINGVIPDAEGAIANFLETSASKTIDLDEDNNDIIVVGSLRFDSAAGYTLERSGGSDVLQLNASSGQNATILVARGSHTIQTIPIQVHENMLDIDITTSSQLTISSAISPGVGFTPGLRKFGAGNLVLAASNTFSGQTHIVEGTVTLTNSAALAASPVINLYRGATLNLQSLSGDSLTLAANQSLRGSGTVNGGINATNNGTSIVPGNSVGQFTFVGSGNITLDSSATLTFEVGGTGSTTGTAGVNYDQIVVDGTGVGGGGKNVTLDNATLVLIALPGLAYNKPYRLISQVGNGSIDFTPGFAGLTEGIIHVAGDLHFEIDYDAAYVDVVFFVPEPSSLATCVLAGLTLLRRQRK